MTSPKQAVLFDLDGTLVDTLQDITIAFNHVRTEYQLPPLDQQALLPLVSDGSPQIIPRLFAVEVNSAEYHSIRDKVIKRYAKQNSQHSKVFPGVRELLQTLNQQRVPWGIVTNKTEELALATIERFNISEGCQVLIGGDTLSVNKPNPTPLLEACKKLNFPPDEVIFVGDSERDVEAANRAQMTSITVEYGYRSEQFTKFAKLTTMIKEPKAILGWLSISA